MSSGVHFLQGKPITQSGASYVVVVDVVQSFSHVQLFATPLSAPHQASLSFTISWSLIKFMSIESVMPFNHLILCLPLILLPSILPSIRVFSNELTLCIFQGASIFSFHGFSHNLQWYEAQENKSLSFFLFFPIYLPWSDGTGCHDLSFLYVEL